MDNERSSSRRWLMSAGYLGMILLLLACSFATSVQQQQNEAGTLQMDGGIIQVKDTNGDWTPVAGESTFDLTGELASTDPWTVADKTFETNELTQIDENLQVGDLVSVQGTVLEDGTWVAYSIKSADQQTDPVLVLIGVVTSIEPWVVSGIDLNVTDETNLQGDITEGMIVRVEISLLMDGTWKVLSIAPLGEPSESSGCATIIATVVSVDGDQIQFLGWPTTVTLEQVTPTETIAPNTNDSTSDDSQDENSNDENENNTGDSAGSDTLAEGQIVMAVICVSDDGTFVIVHFTILNSDTETDGDTPNGGEKVLVCHKPNQKKGGHTLSIAQPAVPAHLAHGDTLGPCP